MLANNALTTLDRMKLMLSLDNETDERTCTLIELLINKASSWVEQKVGRPLGKNTYREFYEADGQQELVTLKYPIVSVDYIMENGRLVPPELYDYGQTANIGVIYRDDGWLRAGYRRGLANDIIESKRNIEVRYTAGYVLPKDATDEEPQTLPADLEGLVWDMVSQAYVNMLNGSQGLKSFSISDVSWTFDKSTPAAWLQIVNLYRRY